MSAELLDIQSIFQDRILTGSSAIRQHLVNEGPFLKVYDHAYVARLLAIMGEEFPAVHTLLGDDEFAAAACAYIKDHPSNEFSVRWLGGHFAQWLKQTDPWLNQPVLSDMAAFEWALGLAFDATDSRPLDVDTLAAVPPEVWPSLRFEFHPALNTVELNYNVFPFQQSIANDHEPEAAPESLSRPETWVVWRDAVSLMVYFRPLTSDEAAGISVLRNDGEFSTLCEAISLTENHENTALRAAQILRSWIDSGWITGILAVGHSWSPN